MDYYKTVTIPTWKEIQQYCIDRQAWPNGSAKPFVDDELQHIGSLLEPTIAAQTGINVKIKTALLFFSKPQEKQIIHVDGNTQARIGSSNIALNLPILNCDAGLMTWHSGDYSLSEAADGATKYLKINWTSEKAAITTKIINTPTLVKIDVPHNVDNLSDARRIMLSVRFTPDLNMEDFQQSGE